MKPFRFTDCATRVAISAALSAAALAATTGAGIAAEPKPWQIGLQPAAGSIAERAADLHNLLLVIITAISVFVLGLLVYTCVRFRESRNPVPSTTSHNTVVEILWTVIPVIILLVIAVPSFKLLYYMDRAEETDMVIKVTGAQWYWNYEYPDEEFAFDSYMIEEAELQAGQKRLLDVDNPMVVPEGARVKLLVQGNDVMHSFFVPALAVQTYTVAGRTNEMWFDIPMGEKTYYGQCNQICGINHSYMPIVIRAVSADDYKAWLVRAKNEFAAVDESGPVQLARAE